MNWKHLVLMLVLFTGIPLGIGFLGAQQRGQLVDVSPYPGRNEPTRLMFYNATTHNLEYMCLTPPVGPWGLQANVPASFSWTRSASTLTSIVDATNTSTVTTSTAHGLQIGNSITVSGATVDTDLNGTYVIQTVPTTTTFTITTANVGDATYTESTLVVTTTAPRSTVGIWAIARYQYTDTNNTTSVTISQWAGNGSGSYNNICDSRATLAYR